MLLLIAGLYVILGLILETWQIWRFSEIFTFCFSWGQILRPLVLFSQTRHLNVKCVKRLFINVFLFFSLTPHNPLFCEEIFLAWPTHYPSDIVSLPRPPFDKKYKNMKSPKVRICTWKTKVIVRIKLHLLHKKI